MRKRTVSRGSCRGSVFEDWSGLESSLIPVYHMLIGRIQTDEFFECLAQSIVGLMRIVRIQNVMEWSSPQGNRMISTFRTRAWLGSDYRSVPCAFVDEPEGA